MTKEQEYKFWHDQIEACQYYREICLIYVRMQNKYYKHEFYYDNYTILRIEAEKKIKELAEYLWSKDNWNE